MRNIQTSTGPLAERPHFELHEIEAICTEALRSTGCYPNEPRPVRIDRFIEKRFGVVPQYEELPDGILGYTKFGPDGVEAVVVTRALDGESSTSADRRIRSTLAHEGGHGLFHAHLFVLGSTPAILPRDEGEKPKILCRDIHGVTLGVSGYDGRWWEFQANKAIGGLLMPRRLAQQAVKPFSRKTGTSRHWTIDPIQREEVALDLAELFNVNPIVARLRLDELFPMRPGM